jgi:hypothetical protein
MSLKNSNDTIGNWTCDLPVWFLTREHDNEKVTLMKMPVRTTPDQLKHTNFIENMKRLIRLPCCMDRRSTLLHSVVCHIWQKLSNNAMFPSALAQCLLTKHSHLVEKEWYYLLSAAKFVALKVCKWWRPNFLWEGVKKLHQNYRVLSCNSQIFFSNRILEHIRQDVVLTAIHWNRKQFPIIS